MASSSGWERYDVAVLRRLQQEWHHLNLTYLRGALRPCTLELLDASGLHGRWRVRERTIGVSRALARSGPWEQVVDVLKHEMAHQWAHEVLLAHDERAHGEAFRQGCERLAVSPSASGAPEGQADDAVLARVRKLLALAQSDNPHEAEAAMARAQELMLRHAIAPHERVANLVTRTVGERKLRFQTWETILCALLVEHFFVEGLWIRVWLPERQRDGRVFELTGRAHHVEVAEYVYAFLVDAAERLWRERKRVAGLRSDRERQTFLLGVMLGFRAKLAQQQEASAQAGLVWVGDAEVRDFVERRYPRTVSRGSVSYRNSSEHAAGRAAGGELVLHRPIAESPTGERRALTGPRSR